MNRMQKVAWFNLIVIGTTLILSAVAVGILAIIFGMPKALAGLGAWGLSGALGLSPLLFREKQGQVDYDERDMQINFRATLGTYSVFWLIFTAACMIPWAIIGPSGSISVNVLPLMLMGIGITLMLIHSVFIVIQYGRGGKGEKS